MFSSLAQDLTGVATYKTQRKVEVQLDSTQMDEGMRTQVMAMLKKQFEKEYELEFNTNESIYKEVEELDAPNTGASWMRMEVVSTGAGDILYKNLEDNRYTNQNEVFSKQFLIQDSIELPDWKLEKETKNIGEYTCFKATYTRTATLVNSIRSSNDKDTEAQEEKEEEISVTAWYTPQIPIENGPAMYGGLPGLILEISDGQETILCSKIVMNPKKGIAVEEPQGGKKVSQEEFDAIMEKKMEEMNERYEKNNGHEDGERIEIRIGG
jgi:GLPGLI family protein